MTNILIVVNDPAVPAGVIGAQLKRLGASLTILQPGDEVKDYGRFLGLVVLGGKMGPYDDDFPHLVQVIEAIREFHEAKKPIMGICLGAQLLARALGQPYKSNGGWEIGFKPLYLTDAAWQDPLLSDIIGPIKLLEFHQDSFHLPNNATLLMTGEKCVNQAYHVGKHSYGFQFHPEFTLSAIQNVINSFSDEVRQSLGDEGREQLQIMECELPEYIKQSVAFCEDLVTRWYYLTEQ